MVLGAEVFSKSGAYGTSGVFSIARLLCVTAAVGDSAGVDVGDGIVVGVDEGVGLGIVVGVAVGVGMGDSVDVTVGVGDAVGDGDGVSVGSGVCVGNGVPSKFTDKEASPER